MMKDQRLLVVSAHAADYIWRSGGTIAKYVAAGAHVEVVVLSFGVRGESNDLWKKGGQTYDSVKELRKAETVAAAGVLGLEHIEFWDMQDYPIEVTRELEDRLVKKIRETRPDIIISHDKNDVLNPDHNAVGDMVWRCSIYANSSGVEVPGLKATRQMKIYGFEPHQTEISGYVPGTFMDITDFYEVKVKAMQCFKAQSHLIEYYTQRAFMRGNHAARLSGKAYKYAESFANYYPAVVEEL